MALKLLCMAKRRPKAGSIAASLRPRYMNEIQKLASMRLMRFTTQKLGTARALVAYVFVWCCLVKLPATGLREWQHDSWEPVVPYAVAHHLRWGRDIFCTSGPLGFLTTDYYWGNFFWPIVIWAGVFALVVTDWKSTRLNSSHIPLSRMPSS